MFTPKVLETNTKAYAQLLTNMGNEKKNVLTLFYLVNPNSKTSEMLAITYTGIGLYEVNGKNAKKNMSTITSQVGLSVKPSELLTGVYAKEDTVVSYYYITTQNITFTANSKVDYEAINRSIYSNSFSEDTVIVDDNDNKLIYSLRKDEFDNIFKIANKNIVIDLNILSEIVSSKLDLLTDENFTPIDYISYKSVVKDMLKKDAIKFLSRIEGAVSVSYPGMDTSLIENTPTLFIKGGDLFIGTINKIVLKWTVEGGGNSNFTIENIKSFKDFLKLSNDNLYSIRSSVNLKPFFSSEELEGSFVDWRSLCTFNLKKYYEEVVLNNESYANRISIAAANIDFNFKFREVFLRFSDLLNYSAEGKLPDENNRIVLYNSYFNTASEEEFKQFSKFVITLVNDSTFLNTSIRDMLTYLNFKEDFLFNQDEAYQKDLNTWVNTEASKLSNINIDPIVVTPGTRLTGDGFDFRYVLPKKIFNSNEYFDYEILNKMDTITLTGLYSKFEEYAKQELFYELDQEPSKIDIRFSEIVSTNTPILNKINLMKNFIEQYQDLKVFYKFWWDQNTFKYIRYTNTPNLEDD